MQNVSWLIVIAGALGNIIIGLITYSSSRKSSTNRWFCFFSILFALYLIANQLATTQSNDQSTLFWIRAVMFIAPLIIMSFFVLVNVFPKEKSEISRKTYYIILTSTLLIMVMDVTKLLFTSVKPDTFQPIPGKLVFLFPLYTLIFLGWSVYILINKYRKSENLERNQLKYFIVGAIIMFSLIFISNVLLVIVFDISTFVVLVPLYTLIFVGLTSYAIVNYRLFDVRVIATEATTVVLWIILLSRVFTSRNQMELLVDLIVFFVVVVFGILLINSMRKEVKQKEELEALTKKLQALDRQKDEFISMAAHELRAPMTAIRGYVSMLLDGDAGKLPDTARDYLTDANTVTERLVRLVNNMLNVGRIEEGRMVFKEEVVKVSEVVNHVYTSFKFEAQRKNLGFGVNIQEGIKDTVYVDVDKLNEVIGNLVSNSIKYTDKGRIDINVKQSNLEWIRVEIVDTGTGISEEEQKKLFQKFYRVESSVGKTIGTGLGLYICRLLIGKFGGKIGLDSTPGKGSNFWFELPVVDEDYKGTSSIEENKESGNIKV